MTKITISENLKKPTPIAIGDYFLLPNNKLYILSQPVFRKVCLIEIETGSRWNELVDVVSSIPNNISEDEMLDITDGKPFTRVSVEILVSKYV